MASMSDIEAEMATEKAQKAPRLGMRHLQTLLLFIGQTVNTILQYNVSVSVVAMTTLSNSNNSNNYNISSDSDSDSDIKNVTAAATNHTEIPHYRWTEAQKSYILSSFYWGSVLTMFAGGYLCKRLGPKIVLLAGSLGTALLSASTPHGIYAFGWRAYCGIRLLQGLCQGVVLPCVHQHLANWAPLAERTRLGAFAYTGFDCGNVLAMYVPGMLATSSLGWPGISYVSAALGFGWCLLWLLLGANRTGDVRCMSQAERLYIVGDLQRSAKQQRQQAIPWRAIFSSAPFYALLCVRCADTWGLTTMQAELPAYLKGVLQLDMSSIALYSALPFLLMWGMCYVYLVVADVSLQRRWLTLTELRKTYNTIALWAPGAIMLVLGFLDVTYRPLALVLVILCIGVSSAATIGSELNTIDLSPSHASILSGILNTFTNVVALLTPLVVGALVQHQTERSEWQMVFSIAALMLFVGNVVFLIWGSADTQPWDADEQQRLPLEPEEKAFCNAKLEIAKVNN